MTAANSVTDVMSAYEPVIGLEVHVQLLTASKGLLRMLGAIWRSAKYECVSGMSGIARRAAGDESARFGFGDARGPGAEYSCE